MQVAGSIAHLLTDFHRKRQIRKKSAAALRWLSTREHEFAVDTAADGERRLEPTPWLAKPLCELIFLLLVLHRHGVADDIVAKLDRLAIAQAREFDWHQLAAYDPSAATPLATVADYFAIMSEPHPFEVAHLDHLYRSGYFHGMDRLPYRDMDLDYCMSRIGHPVAAQGLAGAFADTAFGKRKNLSRYSIDDIYSLTHSIFYLTDLGFRRPDALLERETVARMRRTLIGLTGIMIRSDNRDVLGELLLCWRFCGIVPDAFEKRLYTAGVDQLLLHMNDDGSLPHNAKVKERSASGKARFIELYHTTLVAALFLSIERSAA